MSGATPEPRTAVMILVEASWLDNSGTLRSMQARMENRSAHGACIRIKAKVGVGARVYIRSHREQFSGIVKYCRVEGKEFLVGIQKDAVDYPIPKGPMPKGPMPAKGPNRQTDPRADQQKRPEEGTTLRRDSEGKKEGTMYRAPTAVASATSAKRDAEWMARRTAEPRRNTVPNRGTVPRIGTEEGTKYRAPTAAVREFIARIEEPIAARLMEHQPWQAESPPGGATENAHSVAAANAEQQVSEGNGFQKKAKKKGRGIMKLKWFAGDEEELLRANGGNNPPSEAAQRAAEAVPKSDRGMERPSARPAAMPAAESASGFETELLPMEDIYRAAGITSPRRGYSIGKVVEMLRSEHLRGASRELRRAAVLMALDAAGVTVDEVLQDAKVRQEAIDAYAAEQRKHAEAQWARKAERKFADPGGAGAGEGALRRANPAESGRRGAREGYFWKLAENERAGDAGDGGGGGAGVEGAGCGRAAGGSAAVGDGVECDGEAGVRN